MARCGQAGAERSGTLWARTCCAGCMEDANPVRGVLGPAVVNGLAPAPPAGLNVLGCLAARNPLAVGPALRFRVYLDRSRTPRDAMPRNDTAPDDGVRTCKPTTNIQPLEATRLHILRQHKLVLPLKDVPTGCADRQGAAGLDHHCVHSRHRQMLRLQGHSPVSRLGHKLPRLLNALCRACWGA